MERLAPVVFGTSCLGNLYKAVDFDVKLAIAAEWFKAFDHPMLNVETEEGLRRYRFRDSGRTEFVLDVPAEFVR